MNFYKTMDRAFALIFGGVATANFALKGPNATTFFILGMGALYALIALTRSDK